MPTLPVRFTKAAALSRPNQRTINEPLAASVPTFGIGDAKSLAPPASGVNADVIQVAAAAVVASIVAPTVAAA